ncbi:hypothetical protein D3C72_1734240 [compost metagenome]
MTGRTGGKAARRIALQGQRAASFQRGGRDVRARGRRIRHVLLGEIRGHLTQVIVGQAGQQMRHGPVLAATVTEIQQLVVQVFLWLAGQAGVVPVSASPALRTMAGSTGRDASRHGVGPQRRRLCLRDACCKDNNACRQHAENRPKPRQ